MISPTRLTRVRRSRAQGKFWLLIVLVGTVANIAGCDPSRPSRGSQARDKTETASQTDDPDRTLIDILGSNQSEPRPEVEPAVEPEPVLPSAEEAKAVTEDLEAQRIQLSEMLAGIDQILKAAAKAQQGLLEKELSVRTDLLPEESYETSPEDIE